MKTFTGRLSKSGVKVVLGSHSMIQYAEKGWAYQREMELFAESGLTNSQIIVACTMENARFFRIAERLGSIEKGKIADLVLVKGNPLSNISDAKKHCKSDAEWRLGKRVSEN
jgi:imidazolonepropionase-like amidohydrolase